MVLLDINAVVLILGSVLALSALIVAKQPNAQNLIAKLMPYQTIIGVGLIALGLINFVRIVPQISGQAFVKNLLVVASELVVMGGGVILGAMLGMSFILEMIPSQQGKQKFYETIQKVFVFQILLGIVCAAGSVAYFLYRLHLLNFLTA
ncbi:MAG TPA: hypothetical protein VGC41_11320 [Kofleriaceae bacterium]